MLLNLVVKLIDSLFDHLLVDSLYYYVRLIELEIDPGNKLL